MKLGHSFCLGSHLEQLGDERDLTSDVSFLHIVHLPFPHHIHDLIPWSVLLAVSKEKKPMPGFVNRFMKR